MYKGKDRQIRVDVYGSVEESKDKKNGKNSNSVNICDLEVNKIKITWASPPPSHLILLVIQKKGLLRIAFVA